MAGTEAPPKDFHFVVHIANTDLDGNRKSVVALMRIKGLGKRMAEKVVELAGLHRNQKLGAYDEKKYAEIEELISSLDKYFPEWMMNRQREFETGLSRHAIGADVDLAVKEDINRMKMIRCYKGIRHETGQKVRGQRTRSNGRTGLTMGVTKAKGAQPAAAPAEGEKPAAKPSKPAEKKEGKAK